LLKQRNNAVEKQNLNVDLTEYETALINSPYKDWLRISAMLKSADIEENIYDDFLINPTHYKVDNETIIYNDNWETEAEETEQARISKLHITKRDFYTYLCKPAGIDYDTLKAKIEELGMQADWDLCNNVYYGVIKEYLTDLPLGKTESEIIEVFETYTPKE